MEVFMPTSFGFSVTKPSKEDPLAQVKEDAEKLTEGDKGEANFSFMPSIFQTYMGVGTSPSIDWAGAAESIRDCAKALAHKVAVGGAQNKELTASVTDASGLIVTVTVSIVKQQKEKGK
jgi:hypothetical protein